MFSFDGLNKTFLIGGGMIFAVGLVMAYLKSPRHDVDSTLAWVFFLATAGVIAWFLFVADREDYVRYFALAFTLCGLAAAFFPLMDARQTLHKPGVAESIRALLALPFKTDHKVITPGAGGIGLVGEAADVVTASGTLTTHPLSMPPSERMTLIENELSALEARHAQDVVSIRRDAANAEIDARARFDVQQNAAKELRQLIEHLQTGGLPIILWGIIWLFIGGLVGGLSKEMANFVTWLHR